MVLPGILSMPTAANTRTTRTTDNNWYQRYDAYPPYCSIPEEMNKRQIPKLRPNVHLGDSRIAHVTAVIRHGARTPWSSEINCWDGYWKDGADTAIWDCGLATLLSEPPEGLSQTDAVVFEKKYDALSLPQHNELNGTCQVGQLIGQGYDQELTNGGLLREAYVYDGSTMHHDIHLRLLDLSEKISRPYFEPLLRYRSDDDQRTLMSGQVLLRGMFGTEFVEHLKKTGEHAVIPLHVADRSQDVLDANVGICPRLVELEEIALTSIEFKAFNNSKEAQTLRKFIAHELGSLDEPIDCLMTTICTDRILPKPVNDYKKKHRDLHSLVDAADSDDHNFGTDLFDRLFQFDVERNVFPYIYNDNAFSKLAMGPLWAEIFDPILPIVNGGSDRGLSDNKFHLLSGHDTTIIPLLAALGIWNVKDWPAYASMMILEVHELVDGKTDRSVYPTKFAFRLLYNGQVWTDKIEGCHEEHDLCDFQVLRAIVEPIAVGERECGTRSSTSTPESIQHAKVFLAGPGGIFLTFLLIAVSAGVGALGMLWYLKHGGRSNRYSGIYDLSGISMTNGVRYRDNLGDDGDDNHDYDDDKKDAPTLLVV